MATEFRLPELAESVVEGEIIKWLVAEGESVSSDQPLVEVMTDKVTVELPSPVSGMIEKLLFAEGDVVAVNTVMALINEAATGSEAQAGAPEPAAAGEAQESDGAGDDSSSLFKSAGALDDGPVVQIRRPATASGPVTSGPSASAAPAAAAERPRGPYGRIPAVPAARRLARELGVSIEQIPGSGPQGRVRVADVQAHGAAPQAAPGLGGMPGQVAYRTPPGYESLEERRPLRGLRRITSQQMLASHIHTVRALTVDEADVSALVQLRRKLKPLAEQEGARLSYLPFILKAVVAALKKFPALNVSHDAATDEIVYKNYWNLGMAVATDNGLVVPVLHDVDRKSILELALEVQDKAERARSGALTADDMRGGTFSVTNIGSLGGLFSFPIINVPEAAILGVHAITRRPVVLEDDSIVARDMLYLSLSFDHRLIDGAEAALFTSYLISVLETPESLLLAV
jgi:pyruvate dehydrogenase E2 component (dihydrolipoamide acetyltransferase)